MDAFFLRGIAEDKKRLGEKVKSFINRKYDELCRGDKSDYTIVVYRSGLKVHLQYKQGGWVGTEKIWGKNYEVYCVKDGLIINKDERGFDNWCVLGKQRQDGNLISFS
jgi:hypothetical protein